MEMNHGWLCPRCGKVNSPYVESCSCEWENKAAKEPVEELENEKSDSKKFTVFVTNAISKFEYFSVSFCVEAESEEAAKKYAKSYFVGYCTRHNIDVGTIEVKFAREIED